MTESSNFYWYYYLSPQQYYIEILRTFKTQVTTKTTAIIYHGLYSSVAERIKHTTFNKLIYRETSPNLVRSSLHRKSLHCRKVSTPKTALKISTPQKGFYTVETFLHLTFLHLLHKIKTNRNLVKKKNQISKTTMIFLACLKLVKPLFYFFDLFKVSKTTINFFHLFKVNKIAINFFYLFKFSKITTKVSTRSNSAK